MKGHWATPDEAVRLFDESPEQLGFPLGYFIHRFGMTPDQVLGELRSGRLVASAEKGTMAKAKARKHMNADEFMIDAPALIDWMANPETPPHLIEAVKKAFRKRL